MAKELLYKLAEDYCWEIITNGNPEWPIKQFDLVSICKTAEVSTLCDELREKLPLPPTIGILASAPSKFVPTLSFIIAEIEKLAASCNDPKKMPRSFPLMPKPSLHWRYVHINAKTLSSLTKTKSDGTYQGNVNAFYSIFDFQKFGYRSVEEVIAGENKFTCFILSDGFGICFGFARKAKDVQEVSLELEDFRDEEVRRYFQPCAVDPGRKQVFTSIIHHEEGQQEVRRCSSKERTCYTGSKRRANHIDKLKARNGIKSIETDFPSPKTVNNEKWNTYVAYALKYAPELFSFYNERSAAFRFHDYQGRQRANAEMANILLNGGKKYNKTKRKKTKKNRRQRKKKAEAKKLLLDGRLVI